MVSKKKTEILTCPKCGNENIKAIGIFYQCQCIDGDRDNVSCGHIGIIDDFKNTMLSYR